MSRLISVAYGNGIGPEIMTAVLNIMKEAKVKAEWEVIEIGESVYKKGINTGIEKSTWDTLHRTKVFLKAPITTPQGGGFRSLNVTIRKRLGLYANIRPCVSYHPFIPTKHPGMNIIIIRENEEDLYTGMEYRHTNDMVQCLKIISQSGCYKIARFAFEYASIHNRKKVTCFTKDNIMKKTDGLFRKIFEKVGDEYPECEKEHWIIDIGAAKMADSPHLFDVIVLPNLYGDILSDVAAQISGSVGMAGSANIGDEYAMFEAIHGSAPRRAGQNMANPSGLLQAGILMLQHIGQVDKAKLIQNSLLKTLEDGIHTYDIYQKGRSQKKVGTKEFAEAVINNLGKTPTTLAQATTCQTKPLKRPASFKIKKEQKTLVGVDVFIDNSSQDIQKFAHQLNTLTDTDKHPLRLKSLLSRGLEVWPNTIAFGALTDHWCARFMHKNPSTPDTSIQKKHITNLLLTLNENNIDFTKTENLYLFDNKKGFFTS